MDSLNWFSDYIYQLRKYNYYIGTLFSACMTHELLGEPWWDRIDPQIILGGIPLHNLGHLEELKHEGIDAVLCLLEPFESKPTLYFNPVSQKDWENNGIAFLQIPAEDTYGIDVNHMMIGINFMLEQINQDKKVYVHCKAGVGRSASVVICYFIYLLYQLNRQVSEDDLSHIYQILKQHRPAVCLNENQMNAIRDFISKKCN